MTTYRIAAFSTRKRTYEQGPKKLFKNIKDRCYLQFLAARGGGKTMNITSDKLPHYKQKVRQEKRWRTPAQRAGINLKQGESYQLLQLIKRSYPRD